MKKIKGAHAKRSEHKTHLLLTHCIFFQLLLGALYTSKDHNPNGKLYIKAIVL